MTVESIFVLRHFTAAPFISNPQKIFLHQAKKLNHVSYITEPFTSSPHTGALLRVGSTA
jgi:hypothetical protein